MVKLYFTIRKFTNTFFLQNKQIQNGPTMASFGGATMTRNEHESR